MTAEAKPATTFLLPRPGLVVARVTKAAANDWTVLPHPGVIPLAATLPTGAAETVAYATLAVNNKATAYDAETTTIAYDTGAAGTRPAGGYYVQTTSGEILYVEDDDGRAGATGELTVRRGCLGTAASATGLADDAVLYVLSTLKMTGADSTGVVRITYIPLPEDPGVDLYKA